jgi:elongation factor G
VVHFQRSNGFSTLSTDDPATVRNLGIIAHIDAGKTTTTERMLYMAGFSKRLGNVDEGSTIMDFLPQERARGITIQSAAITFGWHLRNDSNSSLYKLNLVDTPGHVDFTFEVERSLRVLDGAVTILDGVAGVEAQTAAVWSQANLHHIPRIVFVNKLDRAGASFGRCLESIRSRLKCNPVAIQIPFKDTNTDVLDSLGDAISMKMYRWPKEGLGKVIEEFEPNEEQRSILELSRKELVEQLAMVHDKTLDSLLNEADAMLVSNNCIYEGLREATITGTIVPVLAGASFRNIGVQPLLDAIVRYLPSPKDRLSVLSSNTTNPPSNSIKFGAAELCALAFKVVFDPRRGYLTYVRVYSGTLTLGGTIYNSTRGKPERISKVLTMYASDCEEVSELNEGNIGVLVGLKSTFTGDTLVASKNGDILLKEPIIPSPVFTASIEAKSSTFAKDLEISLSHIVREDPSIQVSEDADSNQVLISGMGELHMEIVRDRLIRDYKVEAIMGPVRIAYREAPFTEKEVDFEDTFLSYDSSGKEQGRVSVALLAKRYQIPRPDGMLPIPQSVSAGNAINLDVLNFPKETMDSLNKAALGGLARGPKKSFPVTNVNVQLKRLQCDMINSPAISEISLLSAAVLWGVKRAISQLEVSVVGPVMSVKVRCPIGHIGAVLNDLARKKGRVLAVTPFSVSDLDTQMVDCLVPLYELQGYSSQLRSITGGCGSFEMTLDAYDCCSGV